MRSYLSIVEKIITQGVEKKDRTGTGTLSVAGILFEHDMSAGYPLLTTKKMPFKVMATELEFFIKGITDKQWLKDRNCHIWDEWCSQLKVPYAHDEESKQKMLQERDLGPIYGWQWRHYGGQYESYDTDYTQVGIDQLKRLVQDLKNNTYSRQMIVIAWSPMHRDIVVPPFCHYAFQVVVTGNKINLMWNQRSVDVMLGLPFNISSYALLLHLLAKETGFEEGRLVGFLGDTHIYLNHIEGAKEQLARDPDKYPLSRIETQNFTTIFDWKAEDTVLVGYESYPRIKFDIAV